MGYFEERAEALQKEVGYQWGFTIGEGYTPKDRADEIAEERAAIEAALREVALDAIMVTDADSETAKAMHERAQNILLLLDRSRSLDSATPAESGDSTHEGR